MATSKVDILVRIADDIVKRKHSPEVSSELMELTDYLSLNDVSASQAERMYMQVINPVDVKVVDYWSSNYISKPVFKSLKKFYHSELSDYDKESSLEILIMITSILNRTFIAARDSEDISDYSEFFNDVGLQFLIEILQSSLTSFIDNSVEGIDMTYLNELFNYCNRVGLFSNIKEVKED